MKNSLKKMILVLATTVAASAHAYPDAINMKCLEPKEYAAKAGRAQYALVLKGVKAINDSKIVGDHDYAELVSVGVYARDSRTGKLQLVRPAFQVTALSSDVMYNVSAIKKQGFALNIFMDELDQTWMKLKGLKGEVRMTCENLAYK